MNPIDLKSTAASALYESQQEKLSLANKDDKAVKKVSAEFEALLVQNMLKSMRKTVPESKLFPKSNAGKIYQDMMDQELATQVAKTQSLGLAQQIYDQIQSKMARDK